MEENRDAGRPLIKREKGQEHIGGLDRSDFRDFDKPRKCAFKKRKIESTKQSRGQPKYAYENGRDDRQT